MVYKKLNNHLICIILSQLILLVNRIVRGQFMPGPRAGQKAALIDNKIYFIGGGNTNEGLDPNSDIFYYDIKAGLSSTGLLPWVDLKNQGPRLPYSIWHAADVGGPNQDSIFIIGGLQSIETNLVYQFDTKTNVVVVPTIQGTTPPRRRDINSVSYNGKIYLFGGRVLVNGNNTFFSNLDILDTNTMTWEVGGLVGAPLPRYLYSATLVKGIIYYLGGIQKDIGDPTGQSYNIMSDVFQYDTATNKWTSKVATSIGTLPQGRIGHTAVLVDEKIFLYGGSRFISGTPRPVPSEPTIAFLDTITLEWSTPQLENINTPKINDDDIPKLVFHTATLLDNNHVFIAFGNLTNVDPRLNSRNYYTFDLGQQKIQWQKLSPDGSGNPKGPIVNNSPNIPKSPTPSTSSNASNAASSAKTDDFSSNKPAVIGLSVGLIIVGLGAIAAFIFIYRNMKRKDRDVNNPDVIETPSDEMSRRFVKTQIQDRSSQHTTY